MTLTDDLRIELASDGYAIERVISVTVSKDGIERRGAIRETVDLARNLLIFAGDEMDADTARALINWTFSWLRARRDADANEVEFVSVYGPDGKSVLLNVRVPR